MPPRDRLADMADRKPGKPSLSRPEAERVKTALQRLLDERFKGNRTALAKGLGRSQPAVTQLLDGTNLASLETARRVAKLEGLDVTSYLDEHAHDAPADEPFPSKSRAAQSARLLLMDEWAIDQMLTEPPPAGLSADPGPVFWFRRVEQLLSAPRTAHDQRGDHAAVDARRKRRGGPSRLSHRP